MGSTAKRNRDWYKTPAGNDCAWCFGIDCEPFDADDAEQALCRGHLAEYEGTSPDGLDREDAAHLADLHLDQPRGHVPRPVGHLT